MSAPSGKDLAAVRLATYLDNCGITGWEERYRALDRQIPKTWLDMLNAAGLGDGLNVIDVIAGRDKLMKVQP